MRYPNTNRNLKIKSIRKGWGDKSSYYHVGESWKMILQDSKVVRTGGEGRELSCTVYYVYDHADNLVVEIEPCSELTITYYREGEK